MTESMEEMEQEAEATSTLRETDMSDDPVLNEVLNSEGRFEATDDDAALRAEADQVKKPIKKLVGMCEAECPRNIEGMNFFSIPERGLCFKCKDDCQKCGEFEGECDTCAFGQYEVTSTEGTEIEDDDGNVELVYTKEGRQCHASCKRCTGPAADQCKGCYKGFQMRNNTCVAGTRCLSGEVQVDSEDEECVNDDGTRCKTCKPCNDENCHRCESDAAG